ncbi:phospholipid carrier-dependent glycosyltransferase, partial [Streptomyces sp. NPDC059618]
MTSSSAPRSPVLDSARPAAEPGPWQNRLRRFGYAGLPGADVRERLVPPFPTPSTRLWERAGLDRARAFRAAKAMEWLWPLLVAVLAGVIR